MDTRENLGEGKSPSTAREPRGLIACEIVAAVVAPCYRHSMRQDFSIGPAFRVKFTKASNDAVLADWQEEPKTFCIPCVSDLMVNAELVTCGDKTWAPGMPDFNGKPVAEA